MIATIKAADLFCGAGGASTGLMLAAKAMGVNVDLLAINHWPTAVKTHALNHPGVRHLCESIERINPRDHVPGGRLHLLLAGPECTHHSTARGGRPINDQSRASAWHILKWAQELYIDNILIENVPEFRTWGPLGANGRPLKSMKGQTYRAFLDALRSLGYDRIDDHVINCADYGDPTTRNRLFILAQRGRSRVLFPKPSHSRAGGKTLLGTTKRWRAAREIIDWELPGRSIFERKKPLAPATMARILAGLEKFGGAELKPFLVVLRQHMGAQSVDAPVPTVSAQGQHLGLAQPFLVAMEHGGRLLDADKPLPTITTAKGGAFGVVEPFIVPINHGVDSGHLPRSVGDPLPTLTAKANQYLVEPFVISAGGAKLRTARGVDQPVPTVMGSDRLALVEPFVLGQQSGSVPRSVGDPLPTLAADGAISLVQPFMVPMYGERDGQAPRTHSVDEPVPTIPATGGGKFGVVEPVIVQTHERRGTRVKSVDEPLPTVTALGGRCFGLAEPFITKYNGTAKTRAYSVDDPLDTVSTRDRFGLVQPAVTIDGQVYVLDIRFRMLKPHELAGAMSFPKTYVFTGNQEDIVKQIGNSWPGETAKKLCAEILKPYARAARRRKSERVA